MAFSAKVSSRYITGLRFPAWVPTMWSFRQQTLFRYAQTAIAWFTARIRRFPSKRSGVTLCNGKDSCDTLAEHGLCRTGSESTV